MKISASFIDNFTDKIKKYIELRSIDACEWDCHCAGPAFFIGLLYGNLNETFEIIKLE